MRLFDIIKRKLFKQYPTLLVDCVRDREWYERKYGKEISKYMTFPSESEKNIIDQIFDDLNKKK